MSESLWRLAEFLDLDVHKLPSFHKHERADVARCLVACVLNEALADTGPPVVFEAVLEGLGVVVDSMIRPAVATYTKRISSGVAHRP